jgi:crotonobetainyl-CoA:carnitine CoA-transferase CaiB-like acyl-CoA transferase
MARRILMLVLTMMTMVTLTLTPTSAAEKPKYPSDTPRMCTWDGQLYPEGSLIKVYTVFRSYERYDVYRCSDGAWVYISSSDDIN